MSFGFAIVQPQLPSSRVSFKCVHMIIPPPPPFPHHLIQNSHYKLAWKDKEEQVRTFVHICLFSWNFPSWVHHTEGIDGLRSDKIGAFFCEDKHAVEESLPSVLKYKKWTCTLCLFVYGRTHVCMRTTLVTYCCHHFFTNKRGRMYVVVIWLCWHLRVVWL